MTIPEKDGKHSQELERKYTVKEQTLALTESGHKQPQPQVDMHLLKHLLYTTPGERALLPESTETLLNDRRFFLGFSSPTEGFSTN